MRRLLTLTRPIRLLTAVALAGALAFSSTVAFAADQPRMGTAANYAVMATSEITNTGATSIEGGLALHPGTSVSGAPVVVGNYDVANAAADLAHDDLIVAYGDAFNALTTTNLTGSDLGTVGVLTPGVYTFDSTAQLTGNLTLDGAGQTNPVFIFQMGTSLTTATSASVSLQNGAGACAVFWQVGSSATIGAATSFQGTIMAAASITMDSGATIGVGGLNYGGRALAMDGAVTMINNTIIAPSDDCVAGAPTPIPTATPTPVATVAPTTAPSTSPSAAPSAPTASASPASSVVSPAPGSTPGDTPTGVTTVPVFSTPGISLFPGLPIVPDTRMAGAPETIAPTAALLALAGLTALGGLSMKVASSRRRG